MAHDDDGPVINASVISSACEHFSELPVATYRLCAALAINVCFRRPLCFPGVLLPQISDIARNFDLESSHKTFE